MRGFDISELLGSLRNLDGLWHAANTSVYKKQALVSTRESFERAEAKYRRIEVLAETHNLPVTKAAIKRLLALMSDFKGSADLVKIEPLPARDLMAETDHVLETVGDELSSRKLFLIPSSHAQLLENAEPFGSEVASVFSSASYDIEEAGKCFALGRYTACVFHLMRAAEAAVAELAKKIGATVTSERGETLPWGILVANMKEKIRALPKGSAQDDWLKVHALLHSCNRAYRTSTAHPKATYTEEEADSAMHATKSFMREFSALM